MAAFDLWAPDAGRVIVRVSHNERDPADHAMHPGPGDWWHVDVPDARPGTDYAFLIDGDTTPLPDPRSAWQPHGVHGASRLYDQSAFAWSDSAWTGRALPGAVLYEMHVGTFTPEGTFDAALARLDHVVDLGVDMVELLPVNSFNGTHNWGYDGVCWYAPHERYGGPDGFKRFVDGCHGRGIGVVLDVVYNHLGPSGAYLPRFGPYLTDARNTWGRLLNLDGPGSDEVRRYIVDNALMWFTDFHVDGLRLDAVHALADRRATHLLEQLAVEVEVTAAHLGRPLALIAESDLNDPRLITPREAGGMGLTAQWDDDVHHALHALLTGERHGYYGDFGSFSCLAKVLTSGYFHDGTWSSFRRRSHGRTVDVRRTPGHRFVVFLQDHDQVGNRAQGDRISARLSPGLLKVGAALVLSSPYTPMLFMGEEWAAGTPWQFFTSHPEPELAARVAAGRREEFAEHGWDTLVPVEAVPDPQDPETFVRSTLDWAEPEREPHAQVLDFYRRMLALRRDRPELTDPRLDRVRVHYDETDRWIVVHRGRLAVVCNIAARHQEVPVDGAPVGVLLASEPGFIFGDRRVRLAGESVLVLDLGG